MPGVARQQVNVTGSISWWTLRTGQFKLKLAVRRSPCHRLRLDCRWGSSPSSLLAFGNSVLVWRRYLFVFWWRLKA